jgi:hypothetical protein
MSKHIWVTVVTASKIWGHVVCDIIMSISKQCC